MFNGRTEKETLRDLRIQSDSKALVVESVTGGRGGGCEMLWEDVVRVTGYKKDCLTVDQVRFEFASKDGTLVVVTEDMPGWKELIEVLPKFLPGFPTEAHWWKKIIQPPFATNLTVLYERKPRKECKVI
jgi:hypothetical protein